jgi:hypothetical protein
MRRGLCALAVVAAATASGCAHTGLGIYQLVEPGVRSMDGEYTIKSQRSWSKTDSGKIETWTIDGFALEQLRFFKGIADGESMLLGRMPMESQARYRAAMTPMEITELIMDSLFGSQFSAKAARPSPFGRAPGFRFEVSYWSADGTRRDALVAGAALKNRLQVIVYDGVSLYYFDKYRQEVESMLESIVLAGS